MLYVNIEHKTCAILNCDNTKSSAMMTFIMFICIIKSKIYLNSPKNIISNFSIKQALRTRSCVLRIFSYS